MSTVNKRRWIGTEVITQMTRIAASIGQPPSAQTMHAAPKKQLQNDRRRANKTSAGGGRPEGPISTRQPPVRLGFPRRGHCPPSRPHGYVAPTYRRATLWVTVTTRVTYNTGSTFMRAIATNQRQPTPTMVTPCTLRAVYANLDICSSTPYLLPSINCQIKISGH